MSENLLMNKVKGLSINPAKIISILLDLYPLIMRHLHSFKVICILYIDNEPNYFVIKTLENLQEAINNFIILIHDAWDSDKKVDFDITISILGRENGSF